MGPVVDLPLVIEFQAPSSLLIEQHRASGFPIIGNGPPGTFVVFPDGFRVSLPTDQIVLADDAAGFARVGFGGMRYEGHDGERLTFIRVREMFREDQLSPARSHTMHLGARWLTAVFVDGQETWRRSG